MPSGSAADRVLTALRMWPGGLSEEWLAQQLRLRKGTVKKALARLHSQALVIRVMREDRFVWKIRL